MKKRWVALIMACFAAQPAFAANEAIFELSNEEIWDDTPVEIRETVDASITVDENTILRDADRKLLGLQCEVTTHGDQFLKPGTTELTDYFVNEFADTVYNCASFRFGGTSINYYNYMNNIGSPAERQSSTLVETGGLIKNNVGDAGARASNMGFVEVIKMGQAINPDAEFVFSIGVYAMTPEDTENLAHFLFDDASTYWGAQRVRNGITEPVNAVFEIGNEVDQNSAGGWVFDPVTLNWYLENAPKHIEAIRNVKQDAKIAVVGPDSKYDRDEVLSWVIPVAEMMKELDIKYIVQHFYYNGYQIAYYHNNTYVYLKEGLDTVFGEDNDIQIMFTEHADWPADSNAPASIDPISLEGTLATAQFLTYIYQLPTRVYCANYHSIVCGVGLNQWHVFKYIDGKNVKGGIAEVMEYMYDSLGDRIAQIRVESDSPLTDTTQTSCMFAALASPAGEQELRLILINRSEDVDYNLSFQFENSYTLKEERTFTAPNIHSYVKDANSIGVFQSTAEEKNESNFSTYHMPPKSIVTLVLETDARIPGLDGEEDTDSPEEDLLLEPADVEAAFSDIENHWAKAEITKMAEYGFVQGDENGNFRPDTPVTRAELAAVLTDVFGLETTAHQQFFTDIEDGSWYAEDVNAVYIAGLMYGHDGVFRPDDPVTNEELVSTVCRAAKRGRAWALSADPDQMLQGFIYRDSISPWAMEDVAIAVKMNYLYRLYENGGFNPQKPATRAEAAAVILRAYNEMETEGLL